MITKRIQILIKEETEHGQFNDALYFTEEEFFKLGDKEVQQLAQERVESYVTARQEQKDAPPREETREDRLKRKEELLVSKEMVEAELVELNSKLE